MSRYAFEIIPSRRRSPAGTALSIVLHVAIGILLLWRIQEDFARVLDAGRQDDGPRGGGGGGAGRVAYITLPAPAASAPKAVAVETPREEPKPVPVTPTPTPPPVVPPPVQEQPPVTTTAPATSATPSPDSVAGRGPGQGGGEGGGAGGGSGPGTGTGRGPGNGTGGGEGGTGKAPKPRYELLPPTEDAPKELRGKEVRIVFGIDAEGKVRRVTFVPEIPSGKYARRLKETMEGYRFFPATGPDGTPVPGIFEYTITIF
ncbi:MAG: hypothetical protein U0133_22055 [Gemmatimonadales bacterium]